MTGPTHDNPAWFRTRRPLRVAFLGWARLSLQAGEGSGYNLSASELAAGLALAGHRVYYLCSGRRYSLRFAMHVRRVETWRGVECHELVNSPNFSPSATNFRNTRRELSAPRQTGRVLRWLDRVRAEIVHVHSLEGFPLDLIAAIRASGRPVVVTPHNYTYVCPQVDLLHRETHVCTDYDGGRRCAGCMDGPGPVKARIGQLLEDVPRDLLGKSAAIALRHVIRAVKRRLGIKLDGFDPATIEQPKPDPEAARGFDSGPSNHPGTVEHGFTLLPEEQPRDPGESPADQNERFLRAPHHLTVLNGSVYGARRRAGVDALSHASLVTPPSRFLLDAHRAMGLDPSRGRVVRLGQPHFDQIHRRARRSPYYEQRPWTPDDPRPLRFAFFGTVRPNKGLEVLVRAIPLLDQETRRRCHFVIRAAGPDWPFRKRLAMYPEVSFLGGYDLLQLLAAADEYDVGLLPHIWFENSPLVMLEHLHAGKFTIASRLGGPVEWIVEPGIMPREDQPRRYNGLLFPAGNPSALAACIRRVARGEIPLPSPAEVHAVSMLRSYPDHVREVDAIYHELLAPPATPVPGTRHGASEGVVVHPIDARPVTR